MKKLAISFICAILLLGYNSVGYSQEYYKYYPMDESEFRGVNYEEAQERAQYWIETIAEEKVVFFTEDRQEILITNYGALGINAKVVKSNEYKDGWQDVLLSYFKPYYLQVSLDEEKARKEIHSLFEGKLINKPENARFEISYNNEVTIIPAVIGRRIDADGMIDILKARMSIDGPTPVPVITFIEEPEIQTEELENYNIHDLLGYYSSNFNPWDKERSYNVMLATKAIDEIIIDPGQLFSFNEIVGPRTKEAGYNEAYIIIDKKMTKGVGGGVCQVSSTLYNAITNAKLEIVELHHHTLPVHYVPKGKDAAVVYNYKDFKFKNNTDNHVLLKTYYGYGQIIIKVFGNSSEGEKAPMYKERIDDETGN